MRDEPIVRRPAPRRLAASLVLAVVAAGGLAGCTGFELAETAGTTAAVAAGEERGFQQSTVDAGIQLEIGSRLLQKNVDLFGKVSNTCIEGRVLLTGIVQTPESKDEAGRIAWSVAGVSDVINEIQVHPPADIADYSHDAWISTKLRTDLLTDKHIANINYALTTVNGTVYLFGIAQNQAERDRVVDYARAVSGVRQVVNHVMLKNDPRRARK